MKKEVHSRGQITVFIILGVIILFAFLFVMFLAQDVTKQELSDEQEQVFSRVFKKEALRIYVEDCVENSLVSGIIELGKRGTIWEDNEYENGVTGVQDIAYGISLPYSENYPCRNQDDCGYKFGKAGIVFGKKKFWMDALAEDLDQYIEGRLLECIQRDAFDGALRELPIDDKGVDIRTTINDVGVGVKVKYPLSLNVGGEEYFSLSQFDQFYPTKWGEFMKDFVEKAIELDWQYVDFDFKEYFNGEANCNGVPCFPAFNSDKWNAFQGKVVSSGAEDDIFTFNFLTGTAELDGNDGYIFNIARKNRPPALEKIDRCPGPGYDYLVVMNDATAGGFSLKTKAVDADEDLPVSYILSIDGNEKDFENADNEGYVTYNDPILGLVAMDHQVEVIATSGGLSDSQTVIVNVVDDNVGMECCGVFPNEPWRYDEINEGGVCFNSASEELGCFGLSPEGSEGYLLEGKTIKRKCHGGTCGGPNDEEIFTYKESCGIYDEATCMKVAEKCSNPKLPYYYELGEEGFWCNGDSGCGNRDLPDDENHKNGVCVTEIVDTVGFGFENPTETHYNCGCASGDEVKLNPDGSVKTPANPCLNLDGTGVGVCKEVKKFGLVEDYICE